METEEERGEMIRVRNDTDVELHLVPIYLKAPTINETRKSSARNGLGIQKRTRNTTPTFICTGNLC